MLYYPHQVVRQLQTLKNYIKKRNPTTPNSWIPLKEVKKVSFETSFGRSFERRKRNNFFNIYNDKYIIYPTLTKSNLNRMLLTQS